MKLPILIAFALILALAGIRFAQDRAHDEACARFEQEIARVRSLAPDGGPRRPVTAVESELELRLAELDTELDRIAPADLGIGAPWMWTPDHRDELVGLAEMIREPLTAIVELSRDRNRKFQSGARASLLRSRHRTNLLCASALVEGDPEAAAQRLVDAIDVAAAEDDGSIVAAMIVRANVAIVAIAAQRLSERPGFERDRVACALDPWSRTAANAREIARRVATEAVSFADRGGQRVCSTRSVDSLTRFLEELRPVLSGCDGAAVSRPVLEGLEAPFTTFATVMRPEFLGGQRSATLF